MTAFRQSGLAMTAMAVVLVAGAAAQSTAAKSATKAQAAQAHEQSAARTASTASGKTGTSAKTEIIVSLEDHKLALIEDGQVIKIYSVAVGKPSTPSPVGTFTIARRVANPTYSHNGKVVPAGPHNPVGSRWMGLSIRGYGIHGTNEPNSIGKAASHGCIRMARADLEELYPQIAVGDTVELIGQRDEETAAIFGNPAAPAAAPDSTQLATTQLAAAHAPDETAIRAAANTANAPAAASSAAITGAL